MSGAITVLFLLVLAVAVRSEYDADKVQRASRFVSEVLQARLVKRTSAPVECNEKEFASCFSKISDAAAKIDAIQNPTIDDAKEACREMYIGFECVARTDCGEMVREILKTKNQVDAACRPLLDNSGKRDNIAVLQQRIDQRFLDRKYFDARLQRAQEVQRSSDCNEKDFVSCVSKITDAADKIDAIQNPTIEDAKDACREMFTGYECVVKTDCGDLVRDILKTKDQVDAACRPLLADSGNSGSNDKRENIAVLQQRVEEILLDRKSFDAMLHRKLEAQRSMCNEEALKGCFRTIQAAVEIEQSATNDNARRRACRKMNEGFECITRNSCEDVAKPLIDMKPEVERECRPFMPAVRPQCTASEFRCGNNKCVPNNYRCDEDNDCGDNTDEQEC